MSSGSDSISFRTLQRPDLAILCDWVQRPHVARWWSEPRSLRDIEAEYAPVIEGSSSTSAYVALLGAEPIGFIQRYVVLGSGGGWWEDEIDPGARGIDAFLADGARIGRGLGTAMVSAFLRKCFEDSTVTVIQTDPAPDNLRAIRCYERSGFRRVGRVSTPDGPALLMRCSRAAMEAAGS